MLQLDSPSNTGHGDHQCRHPTPLANPKHPATWLQTENPHRARRARLRLRSEEGGALPHRRPARGAGRGLHGVDTALFTLGGTLLGQLYALCAGRVGAATGGRGAVHEPRPQDGDGRVGSGEDVSLFCSPFFLFFNRTTHNSPSLPPTVTSLSNHLTI